MTAPNKLKSIFHSSMLALGLAATTDVTAQHINPEAAAIDAKVADAAKNNQILWFMLVDGRWYDIIPTNPDAVATFTPSAGIFAVPDTLMRDCQNPGSFALFRLWYGPDLRAIYEISSITYFMNYPGHPEAPVSFFRVNTQGGNVHCNNEVPNPVEPHLIFRDGLEDGGTIFSKGLEEAPAKVTPPLRAPSPK